MAVGVDKALKPASVLLTGASSQIGIFAIPRLLRAGLDVIAVSRKGKPSAYPDFERVQWLTAAEATRAGKRCRFLLSAGPMETAIDFLSAGQQYRSAVIFSSSSIVTKLDSANPEEKAQMRALLASESELDSIAKSAGTRLVIMRPTLVYGCGLDANVSRLARWIDRFGFVPVNGKADGLRQPVHADDLATTAVSALLGRHVLPRILSLAGGSTLSYNDMVTHIFAVMEKTPRLLRLPQWLFVLLAHILGTLNSGRGINSEMVKRQVIDLVFADQDARDLLGHNPRPFAPSAKDFSLPDVQWLKALAESK